MMKVILALMAFVAVAVSIQCPQTCLGPACWDDSDPGLASGTCGNRYYGIPKRVCFDTGLWHPNTQVFCTLYLCPAEVYDNANYTLTTASNTKTGTCIDGYWKGSPRRVCSDTGVWATPTGTPCVAKPRCPQTPAGNADFPETISNATAVVGTCKTGYAGTPPTQDCIDGTWQALTGACTKIQCGVSTLSSATWAARDAPFSGTDSVVGTCDAGFTGAPTRDCNPNGSWSAINGGTPCTKPNCPQTSAGNADFAETTPDVTGVTGTCKSGYSGTPPTQDCINGAWSNLSGSCTKIQCGTSPLASATWAAHDAPLTGTDSVVGTCDAGLTGAPTRDCNPNGSWSGITGGTPCTKSCGQTTSYAHATFPPTAAGQTATGTCDEGYAEFPKATRKCLADGSWASNLDTYCTRNFCEFVDDNVGGATYVKTTSATFRNGVCKTGFTGRASRYCQADGTWMSTAYRSCTPI